MSIIFKRKNFYAKAVSLLLYYFLFFATIHAIWFGHGKALKAGNVSKKDFMRQIYYKFFKSMQFLHAPFQEQKIEEQNNPVYI